MDKEKEVELAVRKAIAQEIVTHREFLQAQFKHIIWVIGIVVASGAAIFIFLFGRTLDKTKQELTDQIKNTVIDYRIEEELKSRVDALAELAAIDAVRSKKTKDNIEASLNTFVQGQLDDKFIELTSMVDERTRGLADTVKNDFKNQVNDLVKKALTDAKDSSAEQLLKSTPFPSGAVLAFSLTECPAGWSSFDDGAGRVIIGVGKGKDLLQKGGNEKHAHTGKTGDRRDKGKKVGGRIHGHANIRGEYYPNHDHQLNIIEESSLPPFVALRFCQKD